MSPVLPHKTPLFILNELCGQHKLSPCFTITSQGEPHTRCFIAHIKLEDHAAASGQGSTQQRAKQDAALNILKTLGEPGQIFESCYNIEELSPLDGDPPGSEDPTDDTNTEENVIAELSNPISQLQEFCVKSYWQIPCYETIQEGIGPEALFTVTCYVRDYKEKGVSNVKKLAKKQAAQAMLKKLNEETTEKVGKDSESVRNTVGLIEIIPKGRTGLVYDSRMENHKCLWDPNFIENPLRFSKTLERCQELGLLERCYRIESRQATRSELFLVHSEELINIVKSSESMQLEDLKTVSKNYDSVYFNNKTNECALLSAGCALNLVKSILNNEVQNGLAIIRPPGHHAMKNEACGFCFFNNAALAARYALKNYDLERILIVDFDVHHGQATQYEFYDDKRVLYFSIHRYEHGAFWPNLRESNFDYIGEKEGKGFNFNVPLNKTKMQNTDYLAIWNNLLLPVAYEYNPQLVIVSAGFDAALGCPEGEMEITPYAYSHLVNSLLPLADGKVCVLMEGGYCIKSLKEGIASVLQTLLGDPCPPIGPQAPPSDSVIESILNVTAVHRYYWKSLRVQNLVGPNEESVKKHIPEVRYKGSLSYAELDEFPFYDYSIQDEAVKIHYESHLSIIDEESKFKLPDPLTSVLLCQESKGYKYIQNLILGLHETNSFKLKIATKSLFENPLSLAFHDILKGKCKNGLVLSSSKNGGSPSLSKLCHDIFSSYCSKRFLVIDFELTTLEPGHVFSHPRLRHVSFNLGNKGSLIPKLQEIPSAIPIIWDTGDKNEILDGDYLAALLHIVLPVGYELAPDLVYVHLGEQKPSKISPQLFAHMVHLISSLANGKLLIHMDSLEDSMSSSLLLCLFALMGKPLPALPDCATPSKMTCNTVLNTITEFKAKCPSLGKFDVPIVSQIWENLPKGDFIEEVAKPPVISDCPHLDDTRQFEGFGTLEYQENLVCYYCSVKGNLALCLTCHKIMCNQRGNHHTLEHWNLDKHPLSFHFADFSTFCYSCEAYIESKKLNKMKGLIRPCTL